VLALVAKGLDTDLNWRGAVLQLGSGAFLSTSLAIVLELVLIVSLVLIALVAFLALGELETLEPFLNQLQDPSLLQDPSMVQDPGMLAPLLRSPLVIATILLVAAVAIPIIEETVKTVGVGLFSYKHPSRAESFFWGIACGAGFALAEGLFNSITGLDSWGSVVVLRLGATLLHCLTGGLMGLAWYAFVAQRRWTRGLGLFASSVGIHGFWNAASITLALVSLTGVGDEAAMGELVWSELAAIALFLALALAVVATGVGMVALTRHVRKAHAAADVCGGLQDEPLQEVPVAAKPGPGAGDDCAV
jgi:RsiW-degrading membrane proteinase PrsW (M82 family)